MRGGGGARDQLRGEGIVIFGDYAQSIRLAGADWLLASAADPPAPAPALPR